MGERWHYLNAVGQGCWLWWEPARWRYMLVPETTLRVGLWWDADETDHVLAAAQAALAEPGVEHGLTTRVWVHGRMVHWTAPAARALARTDTPEREPPPPRPLPRGAPPLDVETPVGFMEELLARLSLHVRDASERPRAAARQSGLGEALFSPR